jgi:hypothetical protein
LLLGWELGIFGVILEGRRIASVTQGRDGGGKSEHQRARCRVTTEADSATAGGWPEDTRGRRCREACRRKVPQKINRRCFERSAGKGETVE